MLSNYRTCSPGIFADLAIGMQEDAVIGKLQSIVISTDYIGSQRSLGSFLEDGLSFLSLWFYYSLPGANGCRVRDWAGWSHAAGHRRSHIRFLSNRVYTSQFFFIITGSSSSSFY